jgi:hypothetical protein
MKKFKFLIPVIALFMIGCDNYLDINDNPNSVPGESVTPKTHISWGSYKRIQSSISYYE